MTTKQPWRPGRAAVWKLLGVAGLAGVAATGVVVARDQRRRQQLSPEQVRERLHERHTALGAPLPAGGPRGSGAGPDRGPQD